MMRTLGQKRAEFALNEVLMITGDSPKKEFKNFSAGAASMILQNGFGQALAFWLAKGTDKDLKIKTNDKHIVLFDIVMKWLSYDNNKDIKNKFAKSTTRTRLIQELSSEMDQKEYFNAQKETLALLEWVKRFANAGL